jgi:hypothetical protein
MKYKRILYFDNTETIYTRAIRDELSAFAETVDCFFYDEIYQHPIFLNKFRSKEAELLKNSRIDEFLKRIIRNTYDLILVKEPQIMPVRFFEVIREANKNVPILNYNWSSVKKFNVLPYLDLFTTIVSFDYEDCKEFGFNYLPLFYLKEFGTLNQNYKDKKYLLSFIGSGFSEGRIAFLERLIEKEKKHLPDFFIYIYTPEKIKSLRLLIKNKQLARYCFFKQLHFNGVLNVFNQSYATIDHPMTVQTGLTIRTFEALASGLHLYTTNGNIVSEKFYSSDRITIINDDLSDFDLKMDQFSTYNPDYFEAFKEYRIDNWLKNLLNFIG